MSRNAKQIAVLDQWFPPRGPCGICGNHPDARHRIWDAILGQHFFANQSAEQIANDYGWPLAGVEAVIKIKPYHNRNYGTGFIKPKKP